MPFGLLASFAKGIAADRAADAAASLNRGPTNVMVTQRFWFAVTANRHPDHDTIVVFRFGNGSALEVAFLQILLLARESGLLRIGIVSIDGTKIDANASKIRSVL